MRRAVVLAIVVGGLLIEAQAGAQECEFATYRLLVEGPGLASPIDLQRCSFADFLLWAGVLPRSLADETRDPPPSQALGPHYDVQYEVRLGSTRTFTVRQALYPLAEGSPWTYTPPGQRFWHVSFGGEFLVRSGWFRTAASARPLDLLRAEGLPATPSVVPSPGTGEPGPGLDLVWIAFATLALLAAVGGALRLARRKGKAGPARGTE